MLKQHVKRDEEILKTTERGKAILKAVLTDAPESPDHLLEKVVARGQSRYEKSNEAERSSVLKTDHDMAC